MLRSFQRLASEPDAPVKQQATNAKDAVAWLQSAQVKLTEALEMVESFLKTVAKWFAEHHAKLLTRGLQP